MRATRLLAAGAALVLVGGLAGSAAAAPAAVTLHGVFTQGTAYWSTGPAGPVFTLPIRGTWNLNVNMRLAPGEGRATSSNIVHIPGVAGVHARWVENELDLVPLTHESSIARVIPDLAGVVNDPANGIYAYETQVAFLDATFVIVHDAETGRYFYASVPGPGYACPAPSAEVPECYDSVFIEGTSR